MEPNSNLSNSPPVTPSNAADDEELCHQPDLSEDEEWRRAQERGRRLCAYIAYTKDELEDVAAAQGWHPSESTWTYDDLPRFGWDSADGDPDTNFRDTEKWCPRVLKALGDAEPQFTNLGGSLRGVEWIHRREWVDTQGQRQPPTMGQFKNWYDVFQGVIFVQNVHSPRTNEPTMAECLRHGPFQWSEVTFLEWAAQCETAMRSPATLQHVVHLEIVNFETLRIVDRALASRGLDIRQLLDLDRKETFDVCSEESLALLGTPNASGTAWLLSRHKETMRDRVIKEISICTETGWTAEVIITIGDKSNEGNGDRDHKDPAEDQTRESEDMEDVKKMAAEESDLDGRDDEPYAPGIPGVA